MIQEDSWPAAVMYSLSAFKPAKTCQYLLSCNSFKGNGRLPKKVD